MGVGGGGVRKVLNKGGTYYLNGLLHVWPKETVITNGMAKTRMKRVIYLSPLRLNISLSYSKIDIAFLQE